MMRLLRSLSENNEQNAVSSVFHNSTAVYDRSSISDPTSSWTLLTDAVIRPSGYRHSN